MKRFIDCVIPFRTCNLRCSYCYITHTKSFGAKLPVFPYSAEHIGRALSVERLGGTSLINICGEGETLLPPEVPGIVREILEQGHYVMVVTNGTISQRFEELALLPPDCLRRLFIKFSFHYMELKKRNWLDLFFANVAKMREAGASFSVELTPSDEMIPSIEDAMAICREQVGAVCHVTVARDETTRDLRILTRLSREEYRQAWGQFDSDLFRFKLGVFGEKRREFCYAGLWSGFLDLVSGELKQCYCEAPIQNIYEDENAPIRFRPVGPHCRLPHCYNAHVFMTLGLLPSVSTPTFAAMRNRVCPDGSEWLRPAFREFISRNLGEENQEWSRLERMRFELGRAWAQSRIGRKGKSLLARIHHKSSSAP